MRMARSVTRGVVTKTTWSAPATAATVKAWTGYVRRKITGTAKPRRISRSSTAGGQPTEAEAVERTPGRPSWLTTSVLVALPMTVATPSSSKRAAGTPSTSLGWRLSQPYTADTPLAYAPACAASSSPKLIAVLRREHDLVGEPEGRGLGKSG